MFFQLIIVTVLGATMLAQQHNYVPKDGYVPDEKTAIVVAEAVLARIYGEPKISSERPFHAVLDRNNVWTIEGSIPNGSVGGVASIRLQRLDGRILSVIHGK